MKKLELATIIASRKIVRNFAWFYKLKIPRTVRTRGIFRWIMNTSFPLSPLVLRTRILPQIFP
nr:MAG TPA: DNA-binding domain protein [Caudoviricetes sp.]